MPDRLVAVRTYRLGGVVRPRRPGPVWVRVQQRTRHGSWTGLRRVRAGRDGSYTVRYTPHRLRILRFRAVADWADHATRRSATHQRRVRARPDVRVSGPLRRSQVPYSWRPGCPVPPRALRMIHVDYVTYRHTIRRGSLVVAAVQVRPIVHLVRRMFARRFPVRTMRPTDAFYAHGRRTPTQSDKAAMRAGNTSAFNCRPVTGNPYRLSEHSYGNAIDINTIRNPYVTGSRVYPSFAQRWLDRSPYRPGMILARGVVATTLRRLGWLWGARWASPDYQHFSSNGG